MNNKTAVRKYIKNIRTRRRPGSSSSPQIERCFFAYMKQIKFRQYKQDELTNKYKQKRCSLPLDYR